MSTAFAEIIREEEIRPLPLFEAKRGILWSLELFGRA